MELVPLALELPHQLDQLPDPRRAHRVHRPDQPPGKVRREAAFEIGVAGLDELAPATVGSQADVFIGLHVADRKRVVRLQKIEILDGIFDPRHIVGQIGCHPRREEGAEPRPLGALALEVVPVRFLRFVRKQQDGHRPSIGGAQRVRAAADGRDADRMIAKAVGGFLVGENQHGCSDAHHAAFEKRQWIGHHVIVENVLDRVLAGVL